MSRMTDLISRQEAIDAVAKDLNRGTDPLTDLFIAGISETLRKVPTEQPKKGKWILIRPDEDKAGNGLYECSECGKGDIHAPEVEVPFCWHCGAHMTGSGSVKERG